MPGNLNENVKIMVDGRERRFSIYVPSKTKGRDLPLVIALHGHMGTIKGMAGKGLLPYPDAVWMDLAEREKFLLVYPQGVKGPDGKTGWNDCRINSPANPAVDDVAFMQALIKYVGIKYNLDKSRVYFSGVSNGGFMALRMALEQSKSIAAVAAVTAQMVKDSECPDKPNGPVSVMLIYGTKDRFVPPSGGRMAGGRGRVYSIQETVEFWRKWNGLSDVAPVDETLPDIDPHDGSYPVVTRFSRGGRGAEVVTYKLVGHGHSVPSIKLRQPLWLSALLGRQNRDIEAAEVIWEFFKDKHRVIGGSRNHDGRLNPP